MNDFLKESLTQNSIPNDHSHQVNSFYYIDYIFKQDKSIKRIMDLGCGEGNSSKHFLNCSPKSLWVGLDIQIRPESIVSSEKHFVTFDGVNIPFSDNSFDIVFCNQVLEHVRYPEPLLKEVKRILSPNGYFIGSVSSLEPYHSHSFWNFTPYGLALLMEQAGMKLDELRPGIDAITLIIRRGMKRNRFFSRYWNKESPLNFIIDLYGKFVKGEPKLINAIKLLFCGQFCFLVRNSYKR